MNTQIEIAEKDVLRDRHIELNPSNGRMEPVCLLEGFNRQYLANAGCIQAECLFANCTGAYDTMFPAFWTGTTKVYMDTNTVYHKFSALYLTQSGNTPLAASFMCKAAEVTSLVVQVHNNSPSTYISGLWDLDNFSFQPYDGNTYLSGRVINLGDGWNQLWLNIGAFATGITDSIGFLMTDGIHDPVSIPGDGNSGFFVGLINQYDNQNLCSSAIFNYNNVEGYDPVGVGFEYGAGRAPDGALELDASSLQDNGPCCGLIEFIDLGSYQTNGTLFSMGRWDMSGSNIWMDGTVSGYRLNLSNGTGVTSCNFSTLPSLGDHVKIVWTHSGSGAIGMYMSINGGPAQATGNPSGLTINPWSAKRFFINTYGATGAAGYIGLKNFVAVNGIHTEADLLKAT